MCWRCAGGVLLAAVCCVKRKSSQTTHGQGEADPSATSRVANHESQACDTGFGGCSCSVFANGYKEARSLDSTARVGSEHLYKSRTYPISHGGGHSVLCVSALRGACRSLLFAISVCWESGGGGAFLLRRCVSCRYWPAPPALCSMCVGAAQGLPLARCCLLC